MKNSKTGFLFAATPCLAAAIAGLAAPAAWAAGPWGLTLDRPSIQHETAPGVHSASRTIPQLVALGANTSGISGDGQRVVLRGTEGISVWTAGEGFQTVQPLGFGGPVLFATGLSADGSTVVGIWDGWSSVLAVRWDLIDQEWVRTVISGGADDLWAGVDGVNADGTVIIGWTYFGGNSPNVATRWADFGGGQVDYDSKVESFSATNADGTVTVGYGYDGAFRWVHDTTCISICGEPEYLATDPAGLFSAAYAVDAAGSVVAGDRATSSTPWPWETVGFRWTATEGMVDLGLLPGTTSSHASVISGDGQVIGGWSGDLTNGGRAFLWSESTGMLDLAMHLQDLGVDMTGWELTDVTGISADGSAACGNGRLDGEGRGWVVSGLPVACRADLDGDGQLTFFDVSRWITAFIAHEPAGDWNYDGVFDFFDLQAYLAAFNTGCP